MDKGKNKDYTGKILSKIQNRLRLLDFLAFLASIKRFERTNGREPTGDEIKNMAKTLHINLDDFCAFLENISSDNFPSPLHRPDQPGGRGDLKGPKL
jgi:hypothetical protein